MVLGDTGIHVVAGQAQFWCEGLCSFRGGHVGADGCVARADVFCPRPLHLARGGETADSRRYRWHCGCDTRTAARHRGVHRARQRSRDQRAAASAVEKATPPAILQIAITLITLALLLFAWLVVMGITGAWVFDVVTPGGALVSSVPNWKWFWAGIIAVTVFLWVCRRDLAESAPVLSHARGSCLRRTSYRR